MSIFTGKQGYDSVKEFTERTKQELAAVDSALFIKDTRPTEPDVAFVRKSLRGHSSVLEIGCGFGIWYPVAREVGCAYVGVDPVLERVRFAQGRYPSGLFIHADATTDALQVLEGFDFTAALFVTVIQHMNMTQAVAALRNAAKLVVPGGEVILLESRICDISVEEAERMYASPGCAKHMIPKSLLALADAVPELLWTRAVGGSEDQFVLVRQ